MSRQWVNMNQSPEKRREKYALAIAMGLTPSWARAVRDWHMTKLIQLLETRAKIAEEKANAARKE